MGGDTLHARYEPNAHKAEIIKLDPADVLTGEQAATLLNPMIKPLPLFDEVVLGVRPSAAWGRVRPHRAVKRAS